MCYICIGHFVEEFARLKIIIIIHKIHTNTQLLQMMNSLPVSLERHMNK